MPQTELRFTLRWHFTGSKRCPGNGATEQLRENQSHEQKQASRDAISETAERRAHLEETLDLVAAAVLLMDNPRQPERGGDVRLAPGRGQQRQSPLNRL